MRRRGPTLQLRLGHDTAGMGFANPHRRKIRLVFAFVIGGAGDAGRSRGGWVGPCPFAEPAGEVFRFLTVLDVRYRYPCLVIAGAGRAASGKPPPLPCFRSAASRSSSWTKCTLSLIGRTMMLFCRSAAPGKSFGKEFLSWAMRLRWAESALLTIDVGMGQVECVAPTLANVSIIRMASCRSCTVPPLSRWALLFASKPIMKRCADDNAASSNMQSVHGSNQLIEATPPPAVFHWASQGRVSLPWEAKALDGLELPD